MLDDQLVKTQLLSRSLEDLLLNSVLYIGIISVVLEHTQSRTTYLGDETEDVDLFLLADTMRSVHSLQISLRIPIGVIEDNNICSRQIDT